MAHSTPPPTPPNINAGRAVILLLVAVVVGIGILQAVDDDDATVAKASSNQKATTTSSRRAIVTTTTAEVRAPEEVTVVVLNGTDAKGVAGRYSDTIKAAGYTTEKAADASDADATVVYYAPGYQNEATQVATAQLKLPNTAVQALPQQSPAPAGSKANVVVIIGADLANADTPAGTTTTAAAN